MRREPAQFGGSGERRQQELQSAGRADDVVKIRSFRAENLPVSRIPDGFAAESTGVARPSSERSSVPHPEEHRSPESVGTDRLRLIEQRLHNHFYEIPPAAGQIAASVLADLRAPEQSGSRLSP